MLIRQLVYSIIGSVLCTLIAHGQVDETNKDIKDIIERYEQKSWIVEKEASAKLVKLRAELKSELQRLQERLTKESKLDEAILVREAIGKIGNYRPLRILFHPTSKDYLLAAAEDTIKEAQGKGYVLQDIPVGYVLIEPTENTVPLVSLVHRGRDDYFTTATEEGLISSRYDYDKLRIEGHIYHRRFPGSIPIYLFWDEKDNATLPELKDASFLQKSYRKIRLEGWIPKSEE